MKLTNPLSTAIGALASGAALLVIAFGLIGSHQSGFQVVVGVALLICGTSAVRAAAFLRSQGTRGTYPEIEPSMAGLLKWWSTPKVYPNGSSFSPKQSFLYTCLSLAAIGVLVILMGCSVHTMCSVWQAAQAK